MAIKGLSLFLSISITAGGRVSRFFSRNPVASYSTCGSQHGIEYKKEWDFSLPRPNPRRHQFSPHETTVSVSKIQGRPCHSAQGRQENYVWEYFMAKSKRIENGSNFSESDFFSIIQNCFREAPFRYCFWPNLGLTRRTNT